MKWLLAARCVACLAVSAWALGCNTATKHVVNQAKLANAGSQNPSKTTPQAQTFKIYSQGMIMRGQISTAGFDRLLGELKINLSENSIYWQGHVLAYLGMRGGRFSFFDPYSQRTLTFGGEVDHDEKTVTMGFEDPRMISVGGMTTLGRTKRGEGQLLSDSLNALLHSSRDVTGLLATTKYVDGNAVNMRSCEYAGNLKVDSGKCLFNDAVAAVILRQMPNGDRQLVVSNGTNELALWPSGGWLLYSNADPGIAVGGLEEGLEAAYMKLREQVRESGPNKESRQSSKGRDEFGGIALADSPKARGTGFLISEDGFLISNAHVVEGANQVRLVTSAGLISARVVKLDAANDLALLKAEGRFAPLTIASSRRVKLGGTVATVGFPNVGLQGFAPKLAKGEIASLSGAGDDARYFQISVAVQPGNSGGALVDERGNVVGVVSAKLNASAALATSGALPENVNYAVKSSYLLSFLESVPEVSAKLKEVRADGPPKKFEDVVKEAEQAAVLVLVY